MKKKPCNTKGCEEEEEEKQELLILHVLLQENG